MTLSPFGEILREAVEDTPGAIGGAFTAGDGETVDSFARGGEEWAVVAAHYGVVLAQVQAALHTLHYGEARTLVLSHETLVILLHAVGDGYYALLGVEPPPALYRALPVLAEAAARLRREMA